VRQEKGDDDSEDDNDSEEEQKLTEPVKREGKKTKEEMDEEVEAAHLSDASGDEEVGERGKVKQRDRTRLHIAALRKQGQPLFYHTLCFKKNFNATTTLLLGINLDEDGEDRDEDDEENDTNLFRDHLNSTGRRMEDMDTSNPFHAGKVQVRFCFWFCF